MKYLLDVNVLVAWGWADHVDHDRTVTWIAAVRDQRGTRLGTSPIPQLGFVRVSIQRAAGRLPIEDATKVLAGLINSLGDTHSFVSDDQPATRSFPKWCESASRSTDAHLIELAERHGFTLATLDWQIPGAFLVPALRD